MVIFDTSVIIDHLRQKRKDTLLITLLIQNPKETFALSVVSIQELYEGKSTQDIALEQDLLTTVSPLQILPYSYMEAELAGKIARDLNKKIEFADSAIAATAIINNCQLATLNKKDFAGISRLEFLD